MLRASAPASMSRAASGSPAIASPITARRAVPAVSFAHVSAATVAVIPVLFVTTATACRRPTWSCHARRRAATAARVGPKNADRSMHVAHRRLVASCVRPGARRSARRRRPVATTPAPASAHRARSAKQTPIVRGAARVAVVTQQSAQTVARAPCRAHCAWAFASATAVASALVPTCASAIAALRTMRSSVASPKTP
jgi:hypothetical protein